MQDRVSNHPGRWVLTPVTGAENTYDLTRADDPTVAGTPLNKATFLPDNVASAIATATGGSNINLPADALNALASAIATIGTSDNCKIAAGSYSGSGSSSTNTSKQLSFNFKPRFLIVGNGNLNNAPFFYSDTGSYLVWVNGITKGWNAVTITYGGSTSISWKCTSPTNTALARMDESGKTYYYVAVGVKA